MNLKAAKAFTQPCGNTLCSCHHVKLQLPKIVVLCRSTVTVPRDNSSWGSIGNSLELLQLLHLSGHIYAIAFQITADAVARGGFQELEGALS